MKSTVIFSTVVAAVLVTVGAVAAAPMNHDQHMMSPPSAVGQATLPGQDAFGAIQEIIAILDADPKTDWSRVNITALRDHLVDMNRLVMDTTVRETATDGGLEMDITGDGGALRAIKTMVTAHAPMIDGTNGWNVRAEATAKGAVLTVTAQDAKEVAHIRGLGFYGLMASGAHHQMHHLGLARGEAVHGSGHGR